MVQDSNTKDIYPSVSSDECIGISTGNWGCGAFGGNPEVKSMIQWIAASQVREKCLTMLLHNQISGIISTCELPLFLIKYLYRLIHVATSLECSYFAGTPAFC